MTIVYIALGSNLQQPLAQVQRAVSSLAQLPATTLQRVSPWYSSRAVGPGTQPDYINGVACLATELEPLPLLAALQTIEQQQQRQRSTHWGPRTLDLDLLLYGEQQLQLPELTIPHPRMRERHFVLYPLYDIAPTLVLPDGTELQTLLAQCPQRELQLVAP